MRNLRTVKERVSQISKWNGELTTSAMETAKALEDYFSSVFIDEGEYTQGYNDKVNMDTGLGDIAISRDAVLKKLQILQMDKSQGPDDIHPALLKNCAEIISLPLTLIDIRKVTTGRKTTN